MLRLRPSIVLALALPMLAACGHKAEAPVPAAVSGQTLAVAVNTVDDIKPVAATLTAYKMAEATARISGTLTSLTVKEGDTVRAGQVIGYVHDQKISLQTSAFDAQTAAIEAQAAQARANLKRVQTLFDKGYYAQAALDQAIAAANSADANVRAARAQTAASAELGGQGAIVAPASGVVVTAGIPKGAVVMAGQSVATITAGGRVVRIELPEAQGTALAPGASVRLAAGSVTTTGTVRQVYPSVTQGQVTADVTPDGLDSLPVGARVTAWVTLGQRTAILLPRTFVQTRYGLDYVRLVQKDGSVIETTVETAPYDGQSIEILGGLGTGDRVAPYGAAQ